MKKSISAVTAGFAILLASSGIAMADVMPLSVSCSGVPSATSITWSASVSGGVAPTELMWGTGATTSALTVSYSPGLHEITIQATDASSTVATSSCSARL